MPQITLTSGSVFVGASGSSLLDAAAHAGVFFPYSCKTGRCSTCKCKVVSGQTRELHPETGLTEKEKSEGWILSCVRSAETDLTIEVDDLGGVVLPAVKTFPCRVSYLERLAPDVIQVKLRLPPTADFNFIPGQYIDVIGENGTHGQQGDIFVQKAPASTVGDLAQALKELFGQPEKQTQVIGTRHGEKLYESLISREEMAHAIDMGGYFRIPADNRDLNYAKYFSEGETDISTLDDYTSHNTKRLNVEEVRSLLLTLDYIKDELHA